MDLLMIGITIAFFAASGLYVVACDRLASKSAHER
jgi:hypothetical protein